MTDTLRQECKELLLAINELGESEWNAAYEMDCDDLLAFARAQQAKGLREAAKIVNSEEELPGPIPQEKARSRYCGGQVMAHPVCPPIQCGDCGERLKYYAKGLCVNCYHYQRTNGTRRYTARHSKLRGRFCVICLTQFNPRCRETRFCSKECFGLYLRYQAFRGQFADCQRCGRYRVIRSKKLCNSCYVKARLEMNKLGFVGACASRIQRLTISTSYASATVRDIAEEARRPHHTSDDPDKDLIFTFPAIADYCEAQATAREHEHE